MKSKTRFARKCDKIFWMIVSLLPIIIYFISYFYKASAAADFTSFMTVYRFDFIADIFESVFTTAGFGQLYCVDYLSYVVGVEIAHCLFDVVVFIPRLAHKWIGKAVQDE